VASHEPLGCAILTFIPPSPPSSLVGDEGREGPPQQRTLALRHIGHEEHLPRERFIECLEVFASKLEDTSLDTTSVTSNDTQSILSPDGIRKCLMSQSSSRAKVTNPTTSTTSYQDEEVQLAAATTATATHSLLQSVKEEDSEDALEDEGSDGGGCDVIEKAELADGAGVNTPEQQQQQHQQQQSNNDGKKSMRSKRRREIQHDHPNHQQNKSTK